MSNLITEIEEQIKICQSSIQSLQDVFWMCHGLTRREITQYKKDNPELAKAIDQLPCFAELRKIDLEKYQESLEKLQLILKVANSGLN